ncbi:hypothetical protein [Nonomuraea sp. NPDC049684]|uniref:hypothetical protein n=1 Tax=Nonomuraea sp. NPDC049684 TaxID=3364356 RepID=UPI003788AD81
MIQQIQPTGAPAPAAGAVTRLAGDVKGPVFLPGDPGYAEEAEGFDRSVVHHPAVIVGAAGAGDVVAAVRFARDHGLGVAVQATGHGVGPPPTGPCSSPRGAWTATGSIPGAAPCGWRRACCGGRSSGPPPATAWPR